MLHPPIYGAYTELFAGLSSEISAANNAAWSKIADHPFSLKLALIFIVAPWGRISEVRKDLRDHELARKYWEWSEEQVQDYL